MGTAELRDKIIQLLNTDNVSYLEDVFDFAKNKRIQIGDPFLELPTEIQGLLQESMEQAERGEVTPHAEVMAEVRKKYNLAK
ncbi:hypothetical protein OAC51_09775 [Flavobacteriaceae bacterium]|nr:hypothetical protein [Flavobacteriaceae bacterium]